jgi:hypothetical protein
MAPMKVRSLSAQCQSPVLGLAALCTLLLGIGWMLAAGLVLGASSLPLTSDPLYLSLRYQVYFSEAAAKLWSAGDPRLSPAWLPVVMGSLLESALAIGKGLCVAAAALITGLGWMTFAVETLFNLRYAYPLFPTNGTAQQ